MRDQGRAAIWAAVLLFLGSAAAIGQTSRGTVTGIVTDQTRASVPGATVELTNNDTNITRTTATNESGLYRFDAVDLGTYDVAVKAQGFKTFVQHNIPVSAAQTVGIDASLEIGDAVTSVEVVGDGVVLQTEAPVRGGNISTTQATTLPVFSRNPNLLAVTLPGVTLQRSDLPGIATFSVNGARTRANNFLIDGTDANDISQAGQGMQIKIPQATAEVSVQTTNFDAEFGRAGGAVVNTITRSGTNDFHGSLTWIADFTNDDAITSSISQSPEIINRGRLAPGYEQYYAGTIGGPVIKDRTFFFAGWQEQRRRATRSTARTTLSALGRQQLRSVFPAGTNPRADLFLDATEGLEATSLLNPIDLGLGRGVVEVGEAVQSYPLRFDGRQSITRVDHHFSDNDMLAVRYIYDRSLDPAAGVGLPGFITSSNEFYHSAQVTETHVFSPILTNELRLSYNRLILDAPNDAENPLAQTMPTIRITSFDDLGVAANLPQGRTANNFQLQDTISWVQGKHTLRFGFDLLNQRARQSAPILARGVLQYAGSNVAGAGNFLAFVNYLDDFAGAGSASRDFGSPIYYPSLFRQSYFFQDRWQVRQNLTLSLGLRYEYFGTPMNSLPTPAYAGIFNATVDRATHTVTAPFNQPNEVESDLNNFGPTLGITWSPKFESGLLARLLGNQRTVFRAGYQISYDQFYNNIASNIATSSPNVAATFYTEVVNAENPRGAANLSNRLPTTPRTTLPTDSQLLVVPDLRNPYVQRWSFGMQRQLPWGLVWEGAYVGSAGVGLYINEDLNPVVSDPSRRVLPQGFSSLQELQQFVPYTLQPRLDPLQGSRTIRTNGGHSTYHSGQFQLSRRFARDLGFNLAYTFSKMLDNGSEIFTFNNSVSVAAVPTVFGGDKLEKGLSLFDRPHRLVVSYTYTLPMFRSQQGILGQVLGGWELAGISTFESGVPVNVSNGVDSDGVGGADRPNINPNGAKNVRARPDASSPTGYVNPDVLVDGRPVPIDPAQAQFIGLPAWQAGRPALVGNAPRNAARTPSLSTTDLIVYKNFRLGERTDLRFGTEFYNVFNNSNPGVGSNSPFAPFPGTPASNVTGSLSGRFLNHAAQMDGGGRTIRYQLSLRF